MKKYTGNVLTTFLVLIFVSVSVLGQTDAEKRKYDKILALIGTVTKDIQSSDFDRALSNANKAVSMSEGLESDFISIAFVLRGKVYQARSELPEAIKDFSQGIKFNEKFAEAYEYRGEAYFEMEEYASARLDAEKALELDPKLLHCYAILSGVHFFNDRLDKAIEAANKALSADKNDILALEFRGASFAQLDKPELAVADLDRVIEVAPDNLNALLHRAGSSVDLENWSRLAEDTNAILKLDDEFADAYGLRAVSNLMLERNFELVLSDLTMVEKLDPSSVDSDHFRLKATAYRTLGKIKEADASEKKAEELEGKSETK